MAEVEWAGRSNKAARRIEEKESPEGRANYKPRRDYSDPSHFRLLPVTPYQGVERGAGRERDDGGRMRIQNQDRDAELCRRKAGTYYHGRLR
ncbi:unnamed protein product [Clonostachys rhizophaga]|uniref:Uncharacterized protein n=1 Tax=Clonostachys rhizophaga TaxID=160324 RepID=A0A9N9YFP5_9HYPO|nr:unnamed protein product [Clonostachys rhizophaga]